MCVDGPRVPAIFPIRCCSRPRRDANIELLENRRRRYDRNTRTSWPAGARMYWSLHSQLAAVATSEPCAAVFTGAGLVVGAKQVYLYTKQPRRRIRRGHCQWAWRADCRGGQHGIQSSPTCLYTQGQKLSGTDGPAGEEGALPQTAPTASAFNGRVS